MNKEYLLIGEKIMSESGALRIVKRWYVGHHPELSGAILTNGWTGKETVVEMQVLKPTHTFIVYEDKK